MPRNIQPILLQYRTLNATRLPHSTSKWTAGTPAIRAGWMPRFTFPTCASQVAGFTHSTDPWHAAKTSSKSSLMTQAGTAPSGTNGARCRAPTAKCLLPFSSHATRKTTPPSGSTLLYEPSHTSTVAGTHRPGRAMRSDGSATARRTGYAPGDA